MAHFALITGATSGIGYATTLKLADCGYNLFLTGRRQERLNNLVNQLEETHPDQHFYSEPFDVSDRTQCEEFIEKHRGTLSGVDTLINNAGLAKGVDPSHNANLDDWDTMIDTNLKGLLYMTRLCLPFLQTHQFPHIVNIGSVAGRWAYGGGAVYCASKFGVRAFSESLRMDLLGSPIRVSQISPGMVETEFSEVRLGDAQAAKKVYEGLAPLSAQDIAESISWVLSQPTHVNIQEIVVYPTQQASVFHADRSLSHPD